MLVEQRRSARLLETFLRTVPVNVAALAAAGSGSDLALIRSADMVHHAEMDRIITGASRGIGRALALNLSNHGAAGDRLFLVARDQTQLDTLAREIGARAEVITLAADLAQRAAAHAAGERLAAQLNPGALLIHNAGIWPTRRELVDGFERAFALNCLSPLWLQAPLLAAGRVSRILLVSAGLLIKGKFQPDTTPSGADFSAIGTYCATKLAGAAAMRHVARKHPELDIAVVHPGVVNTALGARTGPLGWLLNFVKRRWESPEVCAARLQRILSRPRWQSTRGEAPWLVEEDEQAWPDAVNRDQRAVLEVLARLEVSAA